MDKLWRKNKKAMKRNIITLIFALAAVCSTWAQQQPTFRLSGSVVDS